MWYVNISTSVPPGISNVGGCFAEVRLQSKLQIYTGFVTNQAVDFPANDPINVRFLALPNERECLGLPEQHGDHVHPHGGPR